MAKSVNRIRNADFAMGNPRPTGWVWSAPSKSARWRRGVSGESGGVTQTGKTVKGTTGWSQIVTCKPEEYYRVEATVAADLTPSAEGELEDSCGIVVMVEPMKNGRRTGQQFVSPGVCRASEPIAIRTYIETPKAVRQLRISVGITDARGTASIFHVRVIPILEPDETSNILAIPVPSSALPAPRTAKSVCVCSATGSNRPITRLLSDYLGSTNVQTAEPSELRPEHIDTDALLLPDAIAPKSIGSVAKLKKLASDRIVVISLRAFAHLSDGALNVRRIEQEDDPICAKVVDANHATRGFALHDMFSFAWPGEAIGSFVQNQFRKSAAQAKFCDKHEMLTLLESVCDQDATCDRPIGLHHQTRHGGLYVLDIEPAEATGSTFAEPVLAMYLLLSILGHTQNGLGQYVVPDESESAFRDQIREMATRFAPFIVHGSGLPVGDATDQIVTIGREDESFGMPLSPKPIIFVRSGLVPGDAEAAYGAFIWFKQLVRMVPYVCPYAERLAARFRFVWVPLATSWESRHGWRRRDRAEVRDGMTPGGDGQLALQVDIVSTPGNTVGVVLPSHEEGYQRYVQWLPRLFEAFQPGRYFLPTVEDGATFGNRDEFAWRIASHEPELIIDPAQFASASHQRVLAGGGQAVRIEVPASDADFTAYSIQRTDLVATLLEQVIGLQYGMIAVNRSAAPITFDGFSPVAPGEALIIDERDPILRADASQVG